MTAGLFHVRLDRAGLAVVADTADLETLEAGVLRRVAERLAAKPAREPGEGRAVAARAVQLLFAAAARGTGGRA